jgi:hypothetical protein
MGPMNPLNGCRLLAGAAMTVLLAGCTAGARQPAAAPVAPASPTTNALANVDPCALAPLDEVSTVLGAPAHVNTGDTSDPARISCLYIAGPSDTTVWAVVVRVSSYPGRARDWFESNRTSRDDAKQVPGLGDDAFSFTEPGRYAYVEMLKGDLVVEVGYLWQGVDKAPVGLAAYIPRLTVLAGAVIKSV